MWPNTQFPADLVTFTEAILNGKLQFLCSAMIFTYFASSSPLKFSWHSFFNLAKSACSVYWCYIFSFEYSWLRLSWKRGTGNREWEAGNREWGMMWTIYHDIFNSKQFEGAEFIDDNSFLWFLTTVNVSTCYLLGHSFRWKMVNSSILMKLCILHKLKALSSMMTIVFCSFWCPPVKFDTCKFWHR